jgi:multiple sugar transport system ATP-binding protein
LAGLVAGGVEGAVGSEAEAVGERAGQRGEGLGLGRVLVLDAQLRVQTRAQIAALQRRLGTTTVYVTHDQVEAMTMGDRVAVLADGRVQQVDAPRRLYDRPTNASVARFIGSPSMNLSDASLTETGAQLAGQTIPLDREVLAAAASRGLDRVLLGFRPEALEVVSSSGEGFTLITHLTEELGADVYLYGLPEGEQNAATREAVPYLVARLGPRDVPAEGTPVRLRIHPGELHVFAPDSGDRLN